MRFEGIWSAYPDSDSDRAVPASDRNTAPWDSAFAKNHHRPEPKVDAAEQVPDGQAGKWLISAMMGCYNDIIGIID